MKVFIEGGKNIYSKTKISNCFWHDRVTWTQLSSGRDTKLDWIAHQAQHLHYSDHLFCRIRKIQLVPTFHKQHLLSWQTISPKPFEIVSSYNGSGDVETGIMTVQHRGLQSAKHRVHAHFIIRLHVWMCYRIILGCKSNDLSDFLSDYLCGTLQVVLAFTLNGVWVKRTEATDYTSISQRGALCLRRKPLSFWTQE